MSQGTLMIILGITGIVGGTIIFAILFWLLYRRYQRIKKLLDEQYES